MLACFILHIATACCLSCKRMRIEQQLTRWCVSPQPLPARLLHALLPGTVDNDVAMMLAEGVAGSEEAFVVRMNEAAQKLGMTRTHYANPNGLPDDRQVTSARDLAKLTRAIIVEFPEYADIFAMPSVTVGKKLLRTHNRLLASFPGAGADGCGAFTMRSASPPAGPDAPAPPSPCIRGSWSPSPNCRS